MLARLLVTEGFTSVEEVAFVPVEDIAEIEGLDEDVANELKNRAQVFIEEENKKTESRLKELKVAADLKGAEIEGLDVKKILALAERGVKTLDDLADLAGDELVEMLAPTVITLEAANKIIMAARAHWFPEAPAADSGGA